MLNPLSRILDYILTGKQPSRAAAKIPANRLEQEHVTLCIYKSYIFSRHQKKFGNFLSGILSKQVKAALEA